MPKDLIIVRAGKGSLHYSWLDPEIPRSWELLVCPYEVIPAQPAGVNGLLVSEVIPAPGKWPALVILLNEWREWRDYRYVVLADDDVYATQQSWSRFFDLCAQFNAKHAQPALLESSFFSHSVTVRNTEFVARRTSYVEGMVPCFRSDVFANVLATFGLSESGYGIDLLWSKMLGYKDVLVIDETPVLHTRSLKAHRHPELGQKWNVELAKIMRDHQIPWLLKTLSGILPSGEEIAEGHAAFLYRLFRGYERMFAQDPRRFDELIRLQLAPVPVA